MSRHRHVTRILTRFSRFTSHSYHQPSPLIQSCCNLFQVQPLRKKRVYVMSYHDHPVIVTSFCSGIELSSWDVAVFLPRLVIRCETPGQAGVSLGPGHWSRRPFVMTRLSHQWPLIGHRLMYRSYDWCKWEKVPHIIPIHILCIFKFSCMGKSLWSYRFVM